MRLKNILSFALVGVLTVGLSGCALPAIQTDGGNTEGKNIKLKQTDAGDVAEVFVESLVGKDYQTAGKLLGVTDENPFFTTSDVEWYIPRSTFKEVEDFSDLKVEYNVEEISDSGSSAVYNVGVQEKAKDGKSQTFSVNLLRDNDNKWFVDSPEFYVENWYFVTPGGDTKVTINGTEIPSSIKYNTYGKQALRREYIVPKTGKSEKTITLTAENSFGTLNFTVNPTENSESEPYICQANLADEKAYSSICDIWNNCYKDISGGCQASDLLKYVSSNADTNVVNTMYTGIKNEIDGKGRSFKNKNHVCSNVRPCSSSQYPSIWLTDKIVSVYFNYDMSWLYTGLSSSESMTYSTNLTLSLEDGEYKIYNPGDKFFSWYNSFTNKTN